MNQELPTPIQLQSEVKPSSPPVIAPQKKLRLPKKIVILVSALIVILVVIVIITFASTKTTPPIGNNKDILPNISPFPTQSLLPAINDPVLKAINERIEQLQKELKTPFNYQELLSVPVIDLNISF